MVWTCRLLLLAFPLHSALSQSCASIETAASTPVSLDHKSTLWLLQKRAERLASESLERNVVVKEKVTAAEDVEEGDRNGAGVIKRICWRHKVLPNVFVLGAQKAGTSFMADVLRASGVVNVQDYAPKINRYKKEWHFFDKAMWLRRKGQWNFQSVAKAWYGSFPDCGTKVWRSHRTERSVSLQSASLRLADFTPVNLCLTNPGHWYGSRIPVAIQSTRFNATAIDLPLTLSHLYGAASGQVRFIVQLREPLARMQSAWYMHGRQGKGRRFPKFRQELRFVLKQWSNSIIDEGLWRGLYGRQLQAWFVHFHASQFSIIPYRYMNSLHYDTAVVCRAIAGHLKHPLRCSHFKRLARTFTKRSGKSHHPSLETDVPPDLLSQVWDKLSNETKLLEAALKHAHQRGAVMPYLHPGVKAELLQTVRTWLQRGW
mmetsp:Transcript_27547/g.50453  ORF Transcript_27547/g.50453 Transcript_27547/m.50453 type:complete len:429 (+) Transcript_27547:107-1393(+)